jgi:hypothetical protein
LGRARGVALVAVWFQECGVPVLVLREAAAKSFVSRRCSNFNFSRPHKPLRRAAFQQPMNRDLGQGYPVGIFLRTRSAEVRHLGHEDAPIRLVLFSI